MADRLLTRAEVERMTGFKKSKLYAMIAEGDFPPPMRDPKTGTVRWWESTVDAWNRAWASRAVVGTAAGRNPNRERKRA